MGLKDLAKQTAIYGIPSIVGRFLNFLLVPLYTYTFLTSEYGIVIEMYAYVAFFLLLLSYGMETTFFRYTKNSKDVNKVYSTIMFSLIFTTLIFLFISIGFRDNISSMLGYQDIGTLILYLAIILAVDTISTIPFCLLREQNKAFRFAILKIINIAFNIGFNLFFIVLCPYLLANNPDSLIQYVYSEDIGVGYVFLSNLLANLITMVLLLPEFMQLRLRFDIQLWKKMMLYALPVMIWGMAGVINGTLDRILLKYLLPDPDTALANLGIYGACYKLSIIMVLFIQAFRFAAEPFFFKHADAKDAKQTYADIMKYFVIVCSFIFLVCVLFLDQIMYFIGEDYRVGAGIVPILLMANLFLGIFFNLSIWYKLSDRTVVGMYIALIGSAITIGLNFLLIPHLGYVGSAWTVLICYLSMCIISYFWGRKEYKIPYNLKRIFFYLFLVILMGIIKIFIGGQPIVVIPYALVCLGLFSLVVLKKEQDLKRILFSFRHVFSKKKKVDNLK